VLQCVAVCYSGLKCVAVCCSVLPVRCSVLQCVAVCCSVLQNHAVDAMQGAEHAQDAISCTSLSGMSPYPPRLFPQPAPTLINTRADLETKAADLQKES